jgi:hypothetical protein
VMSGVADAAQKLRLNLNPVLKILQIAISVDLDKLVTLSRASFAFSGLFCV